MGRIFFSLFFCLFLLCSQGTYGAEEFVVNTAPVWDCSISYGKQAGKGGRVASWTKIPTQTSWKRLPTVLLETNQYYSFRAEGHRHKLFWIYRGTLTDRLVLPTDNRKIDITVEPQLDSPLLFTTILVILASAFGFFLYLFRKRRAEAIRLAIEKSRIETQAATGVFRPRKIGEYEALDLIGEGGMASVYEALDRDGHVCALKVPHSHLLRDEEVRNRFFREVRICTALTHPNIVRIFACGEAPLPFIAMELIKGQPLRKILDTKEVPDLVQSAGWILEAANALEYSHRKGIVHRDIKPENIFVTDKGIKLMDFGIAKAAFMESITRTGATLGTPFYMAPEQVASKSVDHRADLYSLGVLFYELATGTLPFSDSDPIAVISKHIYEVPERPSSRNPRVPGEIERIIFKLLEKDPNNRYQKAADLASDLEFWLSTYGISRH